MNYAHDCLLLTTLIMYVGCQSTTETLYICMWITLVCTRSFRKVILLYRAHPASYLSWQRTNYMSNSNRKLQTDKGGLPGMYNDAGAIVFYVFAGPHTDSLMSLMKVQTLWDPSVDHHKESPALQERFITDVSKCIHVLRGNGTPYLKMEMNWFWGYDDFRSDSRGWKGIA